MKNNSKTVKLTDQKVSKTGSKKKYHKPNLITYGDIGTMVQRRPTPGGDGGADPGCTLS